MSDEVKIAMIGLDTSHAISFTQIMQAPDCSEDKRVKNMRVVKCMRFVTPFQGEEGLNKRQKQMEGWGVKVTVDFNEAVSDCDAIMLEINDPSLHLEYLKKCIPLKKPVFLDKPLADNLENGKAIYDVVKKNNVKFLSSSAYRFIPPLKKALIEMSGPLFSSFYGPIVKAPQGSSLIWYGVHTFEMLERTMGRCALNVSTKKDPAGFTVIVEYPDKKRGVMEFIEDVWVYGGCLRNKEKAVPFVIDMSIANPNLLNEMYKFFKGGPAPVEIEDTLEILRIQDAAERSLQSGKTEAVMRN